MYRPSENIVDADRKLYRRTFSDRSIPDKRIPSRTLPIVEVSWFDRTDEVRERVAEILRDTVMGEGYPLVQVIFTTLYQERFYEYEQE